MPETKVSSFADYLTACEKLSAAGPVVFRGQTKDYPQILPSLFRPNTPEVPTDISTIAARLYVECYALGSWEGFEEKRREEFEESFNPISSFAPPMAAGMNWEEFDNWMSAREDMVWGECPNYTRADFVRSVAASFEKDEALRLHQDAVLQHYGVPTRAADVSYEPIVALWFATHELVRNPTNPTKSYALTKNGNGVVYAFAQEKADIMDLRRIHPWDPEKIPYFGLRGVRQHGGLYYGATQSDPDLRRYVTHQLNVTDALWDTAALESRGFSTETLFPPASEDVFYRALLEKTSNPGTEYYPLGKLIPVYAVTTESE